MLQGLLENRRWKKVSSSAAILCGWVAGALRSNERNISAWVGFLTYELGDEPRADGVTVGRVLDEWFEQNFEGIQDILFERRDESLVIVKKILIGKIHRDEREVESAARKWKPCEAALHASVLPWLKDPEISQWVKQVLLLGPTGSRPAASNTMELADRFLSIFYTPREELRQQVLLVLHVGSFVVFVELSPLEAALLFLRIMMDSFSRSYPASVFRRKGGAMDRIGFSAVLVPPEWGNLCIPHNIITDFSTSVYRATSTSQQVAARAQELLCWLNSSLPPAFFYKLRDLFEQSPRQEKERIRAVVAVLQREIEVNRRVSDGLLVQACTALANICRNQENVKAAGEGAVKLVVTALSRALSADVLCEEACASDGLIESACRALEKLCQDDAGNRARAGNGQVIGSVVKVLRCVRSVA